MPIAEQNLPDLDKRAMVRDEGINVRLRNKTLKLTGSIFKDRESAVHLPFRAESGLVPQDYPGIVDLPCGLVENDAISGDLPYVVVTESSGQYADAPAEFGVQTSTRPSKVDTVEEQASSQTSDYGNQPRPLSRHGFLYATGKRSGKKGSKPIPQRW